MAYRKQFAGTVSTQKVKSFLLSCANSFYSYIIACFRFSILPCIEKEPFLSVKRADRFEINVGEYMAYTEAIYKENRLRTSEDSLLWFAQRQEFDYTFEDFITKKGVEYIADSVCSGVGDNQTIINQWVTFLNMEEQLEEGYKTVFACTLGRICKELHDKYKDRENPIWKLLLYYVWSWFCYNESESEDI